MTLQQGGGGGEKESCTTRYGPFHAPRHSSQTPKNSMQNVMPESAVSQLRSEPPFDTFAQPSCEEPLRAHASWRRELIAPAGASAR